MQDVYGTELEGRVCYNSTIQYSTVQHSTVQNRMPSCTILRFCCATPTDCNRKPHFGRVFFANPAAYGTLNSLHFALDYRLGTVFRLLGPGRHDVLRT